MGMILGFALFVGAVIGLAISVGLCILVVILVKKASMRRVHVWRVFASVSIALLPVLVCVVYFFPYDTGSPGSNYRILFKYYLIAGFAYAAIPGVAAILSFFATQFCPVCAVNSERRAEAVSSACRPVHILLPLLCLVSGLWLGSQFTIHGDVGSRKAVSGDSGMEASRMLKAADAFFKQGQCDKSLLHYTELIESGKIGRDKLSGAYVSRGWCHIRLDNYGAAVADFDRAIQLPSKSAEAFNGRGWAKAGQGKYESALADFDIANEIFPCYAMVFNNRGVVLKDLGQREEATINFQRAIQLGSDPEAKAYALLNLAWLDYQEGRLQSALSQADSALGILPEYAMGYNDRGAIREDMGQYDEAMADYAKAIELANDSEASAQSRINRGLCCFVNGDTTGAETDFVTVLREDLPMKEEAAVWLSLCMRTRDASQKDIDERISELCKGTHLTEWPASALLLFKGNITMDDFTVSYWHPSPVKRMSRKAEMLFYAGQYWLYQGQFDKARDCFSQCLQLEVRDSNATRMARSATK